MSIPTVQKRRDSRATHWLDSPIKRFSQFLQLHSKWFQDEDHQLYLPVQHLTLVRLLFTLDGPSPVEAPYIFCFELFLSYVKHLETNPISRPPCALGKREEKGNLTSVESFPNHAVTKSRDWSWGTPSCHFDLCSRGLIMFWGTQGSSQGRTTATAR